MTIGTSVDFSCKDGKLDRAEDGAAAFLGCMSASASLHMIVPVLSRLFVPCINSPLFERSTSGAS